MLVTGALGLVSQVGGKVGFIAGLALIAWNVFSFVQALSKGGGLGLGLQDGGDVPTGPCPFGACTVNIYANYSAWEMAVWWGRQAASSGISVTRSLSNFGTRLAKTVAHNEMKFIRCFEANRFSADISNLTKGTRFHGAATFAAEAAEILPTASFVTDLRAMALKSARTGIAGPEGAYASGFNMIVKRLAGRAVFRGVGDVATPVMAVTFAFTTGYNISKAAGCRIDNPIP